MMSFLEARRFSGQLVLFETDANALDYIPQNGTAKVLAVTPFEVTLDVREQGLLRLPLPRIVRFLTLSEVDDSN